MKTNKIRRGHKTLSKEKTLRDEIAMSMPFESIPELENGQSIQLACDRLDLKWSDDFMEQIQFALEYQAKMRYKYADAMLKERKK